MASNAMRALRVGAACAAACAVYGLAYHRADLIVVSGLLAALVGIVAKALANDAEETNLEK